MSFHLVFITASSLKEARSLANLILNHRLAACVSIVPQVESRYWWQGKKEKAKESLLIIKTRGGNFKKLQRLVESRHSYSVPEILAIPVAKGSRKYLKWLTQETR